MASQKQSQAPPVEAPKPVAAPVVEKRPTVSDTAMAKPNMKRKKRATATKKFSDDEDDAPVAKALPVTAAYVPPPAKPAPMQPAPVQQ